MNGYPFPINRRRGRSVKVVDGDTFDVVLDLGFGISVQHRVRLTGIDTPELNAKDPEVAAKAKAAKAFVAEWLTLDGAWPLSLDIAKSDDKYGRFLARVYRSPDKEECLNEVLIARGFAQKETF